ncbi:hypothetical protein F5J12DRAFT_805432 [Pisolithus orientalis]|nr:uncharacterized protein F5J12DRAFT_805432 [Pisolithus orientalis]KAI6028441.1 hypothetical protein F5J12DRAFT_805432 [Pisolithus orientalis]
MWFSPLCGLLFLVASLAATANGHAPYWSRRHQEVAKRARADVDLHKRQTFTNARFTFYDVGLGACGQTNVPTDFIVALNVEQYGSGYPGPYCFQSITISYGGKTTQATIMDECMGCPWGGLDFSTGLFDFFAAESEGVLYGTWWFNDGSSSGGGDTTTSSTPQWTPTTTAPEWTPTTSSTPQWTPTTTDMPTTTWSPTPSTTTSSTPPPTTTSSTSAIPTTTDATSTTPTSVNTVASGLAIPTSATPAPGASSVLNALNNVLVDFGVLLFASKDSS